jgi:hypothetical protein
LAAGGSSIGSNAKQEGNHPMKLPVAIATLFLAATTALPAFAATSIVNAPNGIPTASVDTVQYRQAQPDAHNANTRAARNARVTPWGHCVSGLDRGAESAFPSWDLCSGR